MLGATVMPHVVYLHSALVQPRLKELTGSALPATETSRPRRAQSLRARRAASSSAASSFELIDVFVAMNGAWLINSAMILMAAVAFVHTSNLQPTIQEAYHTLGPLFGRAAAVVFAVALLCSGLSSSTVGVMAGQVIIEGFLDIKFPIFLRRLITVIPADRHHRHRPRPAAASSSSRRSCSASRCPSRSSRCFCSPAASDVMHSFASAPRTRIAGWAAVAVIITLNAVLLGQLAFGG